MRAYEFIKEAGFAGGIKDVLLSKGYKFLGAGQDQDAYLEPGTGMVLKIFGTGKQSSDRFTKGQQSFIDFANFCMANPNNQFLPYFDGWERFEFNGDYYLQIRVERMFDSAKHLASSWILEMVADGAVKSKDSTTFVEWYDNLVKKYSKPELQYLKVRDDIHKLVMLLGGEKECELLWDTIRQLYKLAKSKGYVLDLHQGNFMLGGDGEIIISDPFFAGSWRYNVKE